MKELGKWQLISFISRGLAMVLGLVQSFVIIRVLSVGEWGTIQLAASIGGALGIYQHLGLASASTREIASAKNDSDIFKIFLTSAAIRYMVTLPLAIGLYLYAPSLAVNLYKNAGLILPLKIYALTLLFQGVQSILNSVISGTKRFKRLFTYQVVLGIINISIFIPMVYFYRINGYFWAYFIFNIVNSILLGLLAFGPLKGSLKFPTKKDFALLFKEIFSISIAIYFVKILSTNWEKLGTNLIGVYASPEIVAVFAFAILYARKILSISDAVTDVSLPVLSEKFSNDISEFKQLFKKNFDKVFGFIILASTVACYWAPELIKVLVGGDKYAASYSYIPPILLAFVVYSILDIVKSSVYVPAKMVGQMLWSYFILLAITIITFYVGVRFESSLTSMAWSLAAGSLGCLIYMLVSIKSKLDYNFFDISHWLVLLQSTVLGLFGVHVGLMLKAAMFPIVLILLATALLLSKIFTINELKDLQKLWIKKK